MKQEKAHKIKLVKILEILRQDSDEENYIASTEIIAKLASQGIDCDRRTLYNDIDVLNEYGYEVLCDKQPGKPNRYCIADRSFDVPELRILMDAVQAASFVTPKKTEVFIDKIAALGGSHRAELLKNNIIKFNTTKHTNEQIFYSIDEIERAIIEGKKVSFFYFDYNAKKEKIFRKDKKRYLVNPYATVFSSDNYYLVSYNEKYRNMAHYRIDRMTNVKVEEEDRKLPDDISDFDLTKHNKEVFSMFVGNPQRVTIVFDNELIDPVMDKFGEDVHIADLNDGRAELITDVQVSDRFIAWVCSFGNKMRVTSPEYVAEQIKDYLLSVYRLYE